MCFVEWLFTTIPEYFGLIPGWANLTGWLLVVILIVLSICSLPFVRKRGLFEVCVDWFFLCFQRRTFCKLIEWFQIFYWTHLLYIPFWIALIIHGPNFWKWFLGPGTLFIIEKIVRFHHRWAAHGRTYISSATVFPSRVTHLVIKKPPNFRYYLFFFLYFDRLLHRVILLCVFGKGINLVITSLLKLSR